MRTRCLYTFSRLSREVSITCVLFFRTRWPLGKKRQQRQQRQQRRQRQLRAVRGCCTLPHAATDCYTLLRERLTLPWRDLPISPEFSLQTTLSVTCWPSRLPRDATPPEVGRSHPRRLVPEHSSLPQKSPHNLVSNPKSPDRGSTAAVMA